MDILDNKYFSTVVTIGLALYAALLGPDLPEPIKKLFSNTLFRIGVLALVVVKGNQDPAMAIIIAVAFVLTLDYIHLASSKEMFATTCPQGQVLDEYNRCVPTCPQGQFLTPHGYCRPNCPEPSKYERMIDACVDKSAPKCNEKSGWDVDEKKCKPCSDYGDFIRNNEHNICIRDI